MEYKALIEITFNRYDDKSAMEEAQIQSNIQFYSDSRVYSVKKSKEVWCWEK